MTFRGLGLAFQMPSRAYIVFNKRIAASLVKSDWFDS